MNIWCYYRIECALKLKLLRSTLLVACQIPHFTSNCWFVQSLDVKLREWDEEKNVTCCKIIDRVKIISRQCHDDDA